MLLSAPYSHSPTFGSTVLLFPLKITKDIGRFLAYVVKKIQDLVKQLTKSCKLYRPMVHDETRQNNPRIYPFVPSFKTLSIDPKTPYRIINLPDPSTLDNSISSQWTAKKPTDFSNNLTTLTDTLFNSTEPLSDDLMAYPLLFRKYLESQWVSDSYNNCGILNSRQCKSFFEKALIHFLNLSDLMRKYQGNSEFILSCLQQIDLFLAKQIFPKESPSNKGPVLDEQNKSALLGFHHFFSIANEFLPLIQNKAPQLVCNLKLRFANLPIADHYHQEPTRFNNLYLSPLEQLTYLIKYFRKEEDDAINNLIKKKNSLFSINDKKKIKKLISPSSTRLAPENREKLAAAFPNSQDLSGVSSYFGISSYFVSSYPDDKVVSDLWRVSTARKYFQDQLNPSHPEKSQVQIPTWYHATKDSLLHSIIKAQKLEVRHQGVYNGLWMSSKRESIYGSNVFVMNPDFVGDQVSIQGINGTTRWRALFADCSLKHPRCHKPSFVYLGIHNKKNKPVIRNSLKTHGLSIKVFSTAQVDFIQQAVYQILGQPNLPEAWWGK